MRRFTGLCIFCLLMAGSLSACAASVAAQGSGGADVGVSVSGPLGSAPVVKIPKTVPGSRLMAKTLIPGNGPELGSADSVVANFAVYSWDGTRHKLRLSTYQLRTPMMFPAHGGPVPGLLAVLHGRRIGSRVLVEVPQPTSQGSPAALVLVVDLLAKVSPAQSADGRVVSSGGGGLPTVASGHGSVPHVVIPAAAPPPKFIAHVLIRGAGPKVRTGQYVVAQGVALNWRTRRVLTSSWHDGQPLAGVIGAHPSRVGIPGLDKGLVGQTVGSRVLLIVPPALAYGPQGKPRLGVRGTDTLVLVVDILGAYGGGA